MTISSSRTNQLYAFADSLGDAGLASFDSKREHPL